MMTGPHGDLELLKFQKSHNGSHLEILQKTSLPEPFRIAKLFCSNNQNGTHGSDDEILQMTSPESCSIQLKLGGWHPAKLKIRFVKIIPFLNSRWPFFVKVSENLGLTTKKLPKPKRRKQLNFKPPERIGTKSTKIKTHFSSYLQDSEDIKNNLSNYIS